MICFPYPLLMNAFNNINLAGSCLLTSTEYARDLGIRESKWVYPLGGAGSSDAENCSLGTPELPFKPRPVKVARRGLARVGQPKPITLLGGLTSFGGAGNNYSMHALTEMVRVLRKGESSRGLVLANGGMLTSQYVVCLSSQARTSPYPDRNPLPAHLEGEPAPAIEEAAEGDAVVETYTVEFARDGTPRQGHIVGRLQRSGHRFLANHGSESTLRQLASASKEPIGERGWVRRGEGERNVFTFTRDGHL
ncbi:hypothetical protein JHW43_002421 [Diplocarpon mali]|nr:hypothetical protein JHW43_002421 [Diplocarpon mali]